MRSKQVVDIHTFHECKELANNHHTSREDREGGKAFSTKLKMSDRAWSRGEDFRNRPQVKAVAQGSRMTLQGKRALTRALIVTHD
jgi:hypothetical protein